MGVIATFSYAVWVARYPEFSEVSEPTAQAYWDEATIYHRNDGVGPGPSTATIQRTLLNMLTAHIAARYSKPDGNAQAASGIVGRISNASEGSVSVQSEYATATPGTMAWFLQTKYGADYWQATRPYRTMRYNPGYRGTNAGLAIPGAWGRPWPR